MTGVASRAIASPTAAGQALCTAASRVAGSARSSASPIAVASGLGAPAPHAALSRALGPTTPAVTWIRAASADGTWADSVAVITSLAAGLEQRDEQLPVARIELAHHVVEQHQGAARPASIRAARSAKSRARRARRCWPWEPNRRRALPARRSSTSSSCGP